MFFSHFRLTCNIDEELEYQMVSRPTKICKMRGQHYVFSQVVTCVSLKIAHVKHVSISYRTYDFILSIGFK